jgi:hypothetical protein
MAGHRFGVRDDCSLLADQFKVGHFKSIPEGGDPRAVSGRGHLVISKNQYALRATRSTLSALMHSERVSPFQSLSKGDSSYEIASLHGKSS